jgi:hypothetical protein
MHINADYFELNLVFQQNYEMLKEMGQNLKILLIIGTDFYDFINK